MVITLTGENFFALKSELDRLLSAHRQSGGLLTIDNFDAEEVGLQTINSALNNLSLFSEKRMVILRAASKNKQFSEEFAGIIAGLSPDITLILIEPKLDKRSSFYKTAKKSTEFKDFVQLDQAGLARWLTGRAKEQGGSLKPQNARLMVDRLGLDQQTLKSELDKLLLYDKQVSAANIESMTEAMPQSSVFNLLEAAFGGKPKRALTIYKEQRELGVDPQQIIAMLTWQLHILAVIVTHPIGLDDAARQAKLNPYVIRKSQPIAKQLSLVQLGGLIRDLAKIDVSSKTKPVDTDEMLENYILKLGA